MKSKGRIVHPRASALYPTIQGGGKSIKNEGHLTPTRPYEALVFNLQYFYACTNAC